MVADPFDVDRLDGPAARTVAKLLQERSRPLPHPPTSTGMRDGDGIECRDDPAEPTLNEASTCAFLTALE